MKLEWNESYVTIAFATNGATISFNKDTLFATNISVLLHTSKSYFPIVSDLELSRLGLHSQEFSMCMRAYAS
mgnify:CR=1 FL=1